MSKNDSQFGRYSETILSPDGKPALTLTPSGLVIIHDPGLCDAIRSFLPPGTPVAFGAQLPDCLASKEVQ